MKQQLLQLTKQKEYNLIKDLLVNLPRQDKGKVFEWYLAELYAGNGWLVKVQGGRGDLGADILLYHPKTPSQVSLIIQAKNHAKPLTFDQTKIELVKFEQQAAAKYNCQQFNLVAVNGFVKEAQKLNEFNMLLSDWDYIVYLIEHFNPDKVEPEIELFAHNRNAYEQLKSLWQDNKRVAVVQATGTGKSFIIAKVMADFLGEKQLLLAPSHYIIKQQKKVVPWATATHSVQFMTYAKCSKLGQISDVKLIILDEFHRDGAEVWGAGVQRVLAANPDAYVLGTSATPVRYLDGNRDMSDELFDGNIAVNLSLADAIVKRILPAPIYIAALYTLAEELNDLLSVLKDSNKSEQEKQEFAVEINQAKLDWEQTAGIPEILKKHLTADINKLIVFCRDEKHLDVMEVEVQRWFQKAKIYKRRKVYRVLSASGIAENDENLVAFREAQSKDSVHLLFTINMLNEGLHIADVGAVILLRPTVSPIIFYQQIGRCLQVDVEHTPIIFDFVNNFESIRANDFLKSLQEARDCEQEKRGELGLEEYSPVVRVVDEALDIIDVFESIGERLQPWEVMFQQLVEFQEEYGHCNVPLRYEKNKKLANWVGVQRKANKNQIISEDRIRRLNEIGFVWNTLEALWEDNFAELLKYKQIYGNCNVPDRWSENLQLAKWVSHLRNNKKNKELSEERIQRLNEIGFVWKPFEIFWEEKFAELLEYKKIHGDCNVPMGWPENPQLARWIHRQRVLKKQDKISEKRIRKLDEIGFRWRLLEKEIKKVTWEELFAELLKYKEVHGHCNVPLRWKENPQLGRWVITQRMLEKNEKLSQEHIQRLEAIGFVWNTAKKTANKKTWEENLADLLEYKKKFGHCNVNRKTHPQLNTWIITQRRLKKQDKLSKVFIAQLDMVGFDWNPSNTYWEKKFLELCKYKDKYGDCNVPNGWLENKQLAAWVLGQRKAKKKNELSKERIECLNKINFDWEPYETFWNEMYAQLVEYKKIHGHCNVPQTRKWSKNKKLATWVSEQRKAKKRDKISEEHIQRLEAIGFVWNTQDK
ncbi:Helicase associated domain protein [Candidatus Halobeggiatoa sp. HSG11]|nr:Helicase associated domain protein [Candidatus Halobeggiatoa sp. HSG11]